MGITENFRHYLVLVTIGYITGIVFARFAEPGFAFYALFFFLMLTFILSAKHILCLVKRRKIPKLFSLLLIFIIPLIMGDIRLSLWNNNSLNLLQTIQNDNVIFISRITAYPEKSSYDTKTANATVLKIINNGEEKDLNMDIRLFFKEPDGENITFGDIVKFYTAYIPEENEYSIYQKGKNQSATLSATNCIKVDEKEIPSYSSGFYSDFGTIIRSNILKATDEVYAYNPESAAIVKAILTGDKNDFSNSLYDALANAGFLHVAAISGTHVSILFTFLSVFLLTFRINRKIMSFISAVVILIFSSVAAFTPSVLRASIMLILSMFSMFLNREYDSLTALFFSALIILIIYPYTLFTSSFLLSFGAALGIILFYKYFSRGLKKLFGKASALLPADSLSVSAAAFLGTAPFTLLFFNSLSFWSLITNIWIVPMVFVIFCLGFLSCLFYYIYPPIAFNILRYLNEPFIFILIKTARTFSSMKFAIISPNYIPWCIYAYYAAFLVLLLYFLKAKKSVQIKL